MVDNYDSFTYNLVHYLEELNADVTVKRNDRFELNELKEFRKIILSPGPGLPKEAGMMNEVIKNFHSSDSLVFSSVLASSVEEPSASFSFWAREESSTSPKLVLALPEFCFE